MSSCNDPCGDGINIVVSTSSAGPVGPPGPPSAVVEWTFYPAAGDTIISGEDVSAKPLAYQGDSVQVYLNGVMLSKRDDYTTDTDGLAIVLNEAIVNAGDIVNVLSQMPPSEFDPTNDHNRLDLKIEANTTAIEGLDVRVTANEEAIENLPDGVTTRDVKASGVNTVRSVDDTLDTQQNVNLFLDQGIASLEKQVAEIADGQGGTSQDLDGITADVAENTQGVSDNADSLSGLTDLVSDNIIDINSIKEDIENLPPPTDISDITSDVNDIALQVGKNTLGINDNKKSIDALAAPIDLQPLTDSIETNALGVSTNASAISSIQRVDAKQAVDISTLEKTVVELSGDVENIDITDAAFYNVDNKFTVQQTIQNGVTFKGDSAALIADTGSVFSFFNNNQFNAVIEIQKAGGNSAITLNADGSIRGVQTDAADGSSAVSVEYLQANGGGDNSADLSDYATTLALADEERARILGDQGIAGDLENAIKTQRYDDTDVRNMIGQEEKDRQAADASLDDKIKFEAKFREETDTNLQTQINNISGGGDVNLDAYVSKSELAGFEYATEEFVTDAIGAIVFPDDVDLSDYATEEFVTNAIDAIEFPDDVDLAPYDERITQNTDDLTDLKQDVKIIEGEVGSIVSSKEEGRWKFNGASASAAESGSFSKLPNNLLTEGGAFTFNTSDLSGEVHTFLEAEAGDDLELYVDEDNYGIFKIVSVSGEGSLRQIDTESLRGKGRLTNNDVVALKIFSIADIPADLDDLDDRYVSITGDTMTGNLIAKRLTARDATGTAVCLVEGRMENDTAASRITLSNKINGAAFGQISWHGQDENGWLEINKDVEFKNKELRAIKSIKMSDGGSGISEGDKERITFGGKVEIQKAGDTDVDGFVIRGKTTKGINANLLSVFHNSYGNDAVNYEGKQDSPTNLVTSKWVKDRIDEISPPPVHYGLVSFKAHAHHIADGYERCWWATDADGNDTTGTGDIASIYYHVPAGHYILRSIGTTDVGEIMIFNDGFDLRYHGMATKTSIKDNIIQIDVDSKEEGSGSMAYGGLFTLDMMNCFRETSAIRETKFIQNISKDKL